MTANADRAGSVKLQHATVNKTPVLIEQPEPTLYRVKLDPVAQPGTGATIELKVSAKVPVAPYQSDQLGADPSSMAANKAEYGAFLSADEVMSLNGLVPGVVPQKSDGTYFAGPSGMGDLAAFEPGHYLVSVEVPSTHAVLAAGNALGEVPRPDGRVRFSFGVSGARDFPLFVTRGYQKSSKVLDGVTVESHYLGADAAAGKRVLDYAVSALAEYQKRFGPYPWNTFRVIEARLTGGAGGMEFPGLVSVSTGLYRGAMDPLSALGMGGLGGLTELHEMLKGLDQMMEQTLEFTVAHEVAHQWFAMMIGNDPIGDPVADEPLTQYAALLYLEWKHGKASANSMRDAQLKLAYQFYRMSGGRDGPCERATSEFETTGEYAALIYGKAPLLFEAARKQLGDASFFKGLRAYADENRWRWVAPDTSLKALGKASGGSAKSLEKLRKRWWVDSKGDEDLGKGDLAGLMHGADLGGGGAGLNIDPAQLKALEELMKQLEGN
ncbi:MAG: aminopeptidase [Archangiaceae bacterium]|nr:aminopeptidase [Archangiaceae bacterium]